MVVHAIVKLNGTFQRRGTLSAVHNFSSCRTQTNGTNAAEGLSFPEAMKTNEANSTRAMYTLYVSGREGETFQLVFGYDRHTVILDQTLLFKSGSTLQGPAILTRPGFMHQFPSASEMERMTQETSAGRRLASRPRELLSQTPGGADGDDSLPSNRALFVADLNGDGRNDLVVHSPGNSGGSCAMRCHQRERFGFDGFDLPDTPGGEDRPFCFCGPTFASMVAPEPPPTPPETPPSTPSPPPFPDPQPPPSPPPIPP